jgi:hypothetical protein
MASKRCRLYDENLVHNIMLSTGLSVLEYVRENSNVNSDEICDFVESNAEIIVNDTINHLKGMGDENEKDVGGPEAGHHDNEEIGGESTDEWPMKDE